MFDCHVHSNFSGDSEMPALTACSTAIDMGLSGIAFTDHLDIDYPDYEETFMIDFDEYSKFMDSLKAEYNGKFKILKGIEAGIQPHVIEDTLNIINSYDFDFVIASVHIINGQDPYVGKYYCGKAKHESDYRYLQEILSSLDLFENYDVIGHIGYIRRYGCYDDNTLRYEDYSEIFDKILRKLVLKGKGIEINSSGYRCGLNSPMPDYDIVKRYVELGGEIITLGSDAHYPEHIAHSFDIVKSELLNMGVRYTAHFEQRKPVFTSL